MNPSLGRFSTLPPSRNQLQRRLLESTFAGPGFSTGPMTRGYNAYNDQRAHKRDRQTRVF
jgi:hypothetical protein